MAKITMTNAEGVFDITDLCTEISWSGDYQQCARTLDFGLLSNATDKNIPVIKCELGDGVALSHEGKIIFSGYIFTRKKASNDSVIGITCFDKGIYLNKNKSSYNFQGVTAEAAVSRICSDFGYCKGRVATTGISLSRKFQGATLFDMITTMYTLASQQNKKKYLVRMDGDKLCVVERQTNSNTILLDGDSNLMDVSTSESIEGMINQVVIYDKNDKQINTIKSKEYTKMYGVMQSYIKQGEEDVSKKAQKMLDDNGVERKITVNNLGNLACVTGNTVIVREPYTGVCGLFYIDSDVHTWKNGQYYNKLVLNFKSIMNEKEAGSVVK